jgi:hypothetical protein
MIDQDVDRGARLRKLRADLALKRGDLGVATSRWLGAADAGKIRQAARWKAEVKTLKAGIEDARRALRRAPEALLERAAGSGRGGVMKILTSDQRAALEEELRDRFEDAATRWAEVQASPHYPLIMQNARRGAWSMVSMLLQEIWEGIDR